jgi:hypothetical protein
MDLTCNSSVVLRFCSSAVFESTIWKYFFIILCKKKDVLQSCIHTDVPIFKFLSTNNHQLTTKNYVPPRV